MSIAEYQARQIQMNLPSHSLSDDESDTSFVGDQDLTYSIGMIYYSKVIVFSIWQRQFHVKDQNWTSVNRFDCIMKLKITIFNSLVLLPSDLSLFVHTVFIVIASWLEAVCAL